MGVENSKPRALSQSTASSSMPELRDWVVIQVQQAPFASTSRTSRKRVSFLDLPGELRNQIYRYCLVMSTPILAEKGTWLKGTDLLWINEPERGRPIPNETVYNAADQIVREAFRLFLGENTFYTPRLDDLRYWLWGVPGTAFAATRQIRIHTYDGSNPEESVHHYMHSDPLVSIERTLQRAYPFNLPKTLGKSVVAYGIDLRGEAMGETAWVSLADIDQYEAVPPDLEIGQWQWTVQRK